jgi:hypothetical protein
MSADTAGQRLHNRATRGEALSVEEQAQLEEWYARLDREEAAALAGTHPPASVTELRTQIKASLAELAAATQRNQALAAENAALRQEVAALQRQLAQKLTTQPA